MGKLPTYLDSLMVVLAFAIGFALGEFGLIPLHPQQPNSPVACPVSTQGKNASYDQGYQAALEFARTKLGDAGFSRSNSFPINDFGATVKSVDGQNLMVEIDPLKIDIFQEGKLSKKVATTDQTVFERRVQKSSNQYEAERSKYSNDLEAYLAKFKDKPSASTADQPKPPLLYTIEKISLRDIKPDDRVSIHVPTDLLTSENLVADSVVVNQYVSVTAPVAPSSAK